MFRRQSGFTLIELVVVIVVLGILAATALPKFSGIQQGARIATLNGARGAVSTAMNIATATAQAQSLGFSSTVVLDGTSISMVGNYPVSTPSWTTSGIFTAAGLDTSFTSIGGQAGSGQILTIAVMNAPTPGNCAFSYTSAVSTGSTPPTISSNVTSGC